MASPFSQPGYMPTAPQQRIMHYGSIVDSDALDAIACLRIEGMSYKYMNQKMIEHHVRRIMEERAKNNMTSPTYPSRPPDARTAIEWAREQEEVRGRSVYQ